MPNHEEEYTAADREWNEIARMHPNENPFTHPAKPGRALSGWRSGAFTCRKATSRSS